ncbi:MAG: OmpA family protein [Acidobacteriota bacterium]|nr:OmpA family protein [Acidobacteriota bacterium]
MIRFKILLLGLVLTLVPFASAEDAEGCTDHPLLSRMPNFYIEECETQEFGEEEMYFGEDQSRMVEGKRTAISYAIKEDAPRVSELQVRRNYINALTKVGGKLMYEDKYSAFLKLEKSGKETWVHVRVYGDATAYDLRFIEVEAMRQDVTASEMLKALNEQGFIALYINFDTDKAAIKEESRSTIAQIIALLRENPALKVSIEGHTDNTGTAQHNKTLSEQRAQAVLNAVVQGGIGKERLSSRGWGQEKPIADNRTEEGKAKNRRVEIVKQ